MLALQQVCHKKLQAKPTPDSKYILTPQDEPAHVTLQQIVTDKSLDGQSIVLLPVDRVTIAVIPRVPKDITPEEIQDLVPDISKAVRLTTYDHVAKIPVPTMSVKVWVKGPLPQEPIDLGPLGHRQLRAFVPEPTRCYRCQKFGHRAQNCNQNYRCSLCAQNHRTEVCLEKKRQGQEIQLRCPNCQGPHSAASLACKLRKQKAQETANRFQAHQARAHQQPHTPPQPPPSITDPVAFPALPTTPNATVPPHQTSPHLITNVQLQAILAAVVQLITSIVPSPQTDLPAIKIKIQEITAAALQQPRPATPADSNITQHKVSLKRPLSHSHDITHSKKSPARQVSTIYQNPPFSETSNLQHQTEVNTMET